MNTLSISLAYVPCNFTLFLVKTTYTLTPNVATTFHREPPVYYEPCRLSTERLALLPTSAWWTQKDLHSYPHQHGGHRKTCTVTHISTVDTERLALLPTSARWTQKDLHCYPHQHGGHRKTCTVTHISTVDTERLALLPTSAQWTQKDLHCYPHQHGG